MSELKYFYKTKDGKGWLADRVPHKDLVKKGEYVEITKEEWDAHAANLHQNKPASEAQLKKREIANLKHQLSLSDYKAIKYAEGWISEEDYAEIKSARQALRDEINVLEEQVK